MSIDSATLIDLESGKLRRSLGKRLGLQPGDALIVIDAQNDFLPGGKLAVPNADEVIALLNDYVAAFAERALPIFFTRDWHPSDHCSFEQHGGTWPAHCVQGSHGAEWAADLHVPTQAHIISKGSDSAADAYSGFAGTSLFPQLRALKIRRLFIGGLATDYCVRATVLDARSHGFAVVVLADASRGVNVQPGADKRAIREMLDAGATVSPGVSPGERL